jgi:hypothetical protein
VSQPEVRCRGTHEIAAPPQQNRLIPLRGLFLLAAWKS